MHASIVNLKNTGKRMETCISFFMIMWKFLPNILLKHELFLFFVRNELINKKKIDKSF